MPLVEILDKIQKGLPADAESGLRSLVADALLEASTITDSLGARNRENEKLRKTNDELQSKVESLSSSDELKKKDDLIAELQPFKIKYEEILKKEEDTLRKEWDETAALFALPETDKRYPAIQKVKANFTFPDDPKKPLELQHVKDNLRIFKAVSATGAIEAPQPPDSDGKVPINPDTTPVAVSSGQAILDKIKRDRKTSS